MEDSTSSVVVDRGGGRGAVLRRAESYLGPASLGSLSRARRQQKAKTAISDLPPVARSEGILRVASFQSRASRAVSISSLWQQNPKKSS